MGALRSRPEAAIDLHASIHPTDAFVFFVRFVVKNPVSVAAAAAIY
jgi:hypothetical protein